MVKIYDCFLFSNEIDLLTVRFNQLYNIIDYFVICEAGYTFTGQKKDKVFKNNKHLFNDFLDKVIYLEIDEFPENVPNEKKEFYQKEFLLTGLKSIESDDLIIFGDVDEIPKKEAIERAMRFDGVSHLRMDMYQYFINMFYGDNWLAPYIVQYKYINKLTSVSPEIGGGMNYARWHMEAMTRDADIPYQIIDKSGWHFTFIGGIKVILEKINSYSHANDYWPSMMRDEKRLQQVLDIGIKIWTPDELVSYVPVDNRFPEYIVKNQKELTKKGLIRDIFEAYKSLQHAYMDIRKRLCFSNLDTDKTFEDFGNLKPLEYLQYIGLPSVKLEYLHSPTPKGRLISSDCNATQSSISPWSHCQTVEEDAMQALHGYPNGNYSFHTNNDESPWWEVDLGKEQDISEIRIFNRVFPLDAMQDLQRRAQGLQIYFSHDRENYDCVYSHQSEDLIGGINGSPLIFVPKNLKFARYVKLQLSGRNFFHLDKIYIYGEK
ncbi:discoidin domain-containing protein [Acetobacter sp. A11-2]|uniref:discoidin domain-containing protein n=1 Tax=Acetobacter sp. A11-2 TaxID=3157859 RepID=UPI0032ECCB70